MTELKNELTWSFSRDRLFKECRRAYYYNYYASWDGWSAEAPEITRKAYLLKNIRNIDAWIGDILHETIKWILYNLTQEKAITFEEAKVTVKSQLLKTWEQSRSRAWQKNIKQNLNLFEHYYDRKLKREDLTPKMIKVVKGLENFYSTQLLEAFKNIPATDVLTIDELDSFNFNGIKTFAIPDYAVKKGGFSVLFDWKTGKPSEKDTLQLSCYVLYAVRKWGLNPNDVKIVPVYLSQDTVSVEPIQSISIDEVSSYIQNSIDDMKAILTNSAENIANIANFKCTTDNWRCKNCKFQEICR